MNNFWVVENQTVLFVLSNSMGALAETAARRPTLVNVYMLLLRGQHF